MPKQQYRIRNWREYNASLVARGRITLWFDDESIHEWFSNEHSGKRGRPHIYSDKAITCLLLIKSVFHLDFRKLQGFVASFAAFLNRDITVPCYSQICRRQST